MQLNTRAVHRSLRYGRSSHSWGVPVNGGYARSSEQPRSHSSAGATDPSGFCCSGSGGGGRAVEESSEPAGERSSQSRWSVACTTGTPAGQRDRRSTVGPQVMGGSWPLRAFHQARVAWKAGAWSTRIILGKFTACLRGLVSAPRGRIGFVEGTAGGPPLPVSSCFAGRGCGAGAHTRRGPAPTARGSSTHKNQAPAILLLAAHNTVEIRPCRSGLPGSAGAIPVHPEETRALRLVNQLAH
jgi:hypothetical protein